MKDYVGQASLCLWVLSWLYEWYVCVCVSLSLYNPLLFFNLPWWSLICLPFLKFIYLLIHLTHVVVGLFKFLSFTFECLLYILNLSPLLGMWSAFIQFCGSLSLPPFLPPSLNLWLPVWIEYSWCISGGWRTTCGVGAWHSLLFETGSLINLDLYQVD
jgi:hypothetical protein